MPRPLGNDQAQALQLSSGQHKPCGDHLPSEHAVLAGTVEPVRAQSQIHAQEGSTSPFRLRQLPLTGTKTCIHREKRSLGRGCTAGGPRSVQVLRSPPPDRLQECSSCLIPLELCKMEPEVGFEPTTFRLPDGCSASIWSAPEGSCLLTLAAPSVQTGSRRIVWMIIGMIKAHPIKNRMPRRLTPP